MRMLVRAVWIVVVLYILALGPYGCYDRKLYVSLQAYFAELIPHRNLRNEAIHLFPDVCRPLRARRSIRGHAALGNRIPPDGARHREQHQDVTFGTTGAAQVSTR